MRQPEVCKHQVCDHCGGRFGMVTHRWWGNKFCNRRCKNAYLRENHHTLSGWFIPRFFTFAGGACLAAVVAVALLTLLLASANAAPGEECQYPARRSGSTRNLDSAGGQVEEGDRVLAALNEIKLLHQLITVVPHGKLCASMCIPISLQGEDRLATRASLWIFHEAAQRQANGQQRIDIAETWRLSANATEHGFMAEAGREWRQ
jgi:hypothetical protein